MKISKIGDKILCLTYPSRLELTTAWQRIDEFFESANPKMVGRYFDWDMLIKQYTDENGNPVLFQDLDGMWKWYYSYWDGFNMPVQVLNKFALEFSMKLSKAEQKIIDVLKMNPNCTYIIAVVEGGLESTYRHEVAHALSYVYPEYKNEAQVVVSNIPASLRSKFEDGLNAMMYSPDVFDDEIQAYLVGYGRKEYEFYFPGITEEEVRPYVDQMAVIFNAYATKFGMAIGFFWGDGEWKCSGVKDENFKNVNFIKQ